jgi:transcription termination factor 2
MAVGPYDLYPHQLAAVHWMAEREKDDEVRGGLLCDDMGLGKTITTVAFLHQHPVESTLILCPLAVVHQWVRSFKAVGQMSIYTLHKQTWKLESAGLGSEKVYLANYDKLTSADDAFAMHFQRVVCDEAHILRNCEAKKTKAVKHLGADRYWMLTGTPIVNRGADLASLMHILNTNINPFTSKSDETLRGWMHTYALSRSVDQLRDELPSIFPKAPIVKQHRIEFTTDEEALFYRGIQKRIAANMMHLMAHDNPGSLALLTLLLRLRQISVHPQVYIASKKRGLAGYERANWTASSSKIDHICKLLKEEPASQGFVIFCNFKDEMDVLSEHLQKLSCVGKVLTYHGGMTNSQRAEVVTESEILANKLRTYDVGAIQTILDKALPKVLLPEDIHRHIQQFVGVQHTVMLVQIQSGGTGLNLQHMSRVIFTTPWWTAALMDQAAGRVLRIGQKNQVVIHHIHLREEETTSLNIDDYINEKVETKRELCMDLLAAANHSAVLVA